MEDGGIFVFATVPDADHGFLNLNGEDIDLDQYEADGQDEFTAALEAAKDVLADENATQEQIDKALADLEAAIDALVKKTTAGGAGSEPEKDPESDPESDPENGNESDTVLPGTGSNGFSAAAVALLWAGIGIVLAVSVVIYRRREEE